MAVAHAARAWRQVSIEPFSHPNAPGPQGDDEEASFSKRSSAKSIASALLAKWLFAISGYTSDVIPALDSLP